jgi:hypothetical protein
MLTAPGRTHDAAARYRQHPPPPGPPVACARPPCAVLRRHSGRASFGAHTGAHFTCFTLLTLLALRGPTPSFRSGLVRGSYRCSLYLLYRYKSIQILTLRAARQWADGTVPLSLAVTSPALKFTRFPCTHVQTLTRCNTLQRAATRCLRIQWADGTVPLFGIYVC